MYATDPVSVIVGHALKLRESCREALQRDCRSSGTLVVSALLHEEREHLTSFQEEPQQRI